MKVEQEEKVWGKVAHLEGESSLVSMLKVKKGFRCSTHFHRRRFNQFFVVKGKIEIVIFSRGEGGKPVESARKIVGPRQTVTVMPMTIHRFEVLEDGEVIEIYWTLWDNQVDIYDIERLDEGGPIEVKVET